MAAHIQRPSIDTAITMLYECAEITPPSAHESIVPLGELVAGQNLTCTELPGLTAQTASDFLLQRGGIVEPLDSVRQEPLAGFLYANSIFGSIFIERDDPLTRRRFSLSHELAHYLLHFRPMLIAADAGERALFEATDAFRKADEEVEPADMPKGEINLSNLSVGIRLPVTFAQMEREANEFAGQLLMPESTVRELVAQYGQHFQGGDLVVRLSTDMLVSRAAMRWRLRNLGLG